MVTCRLQTTGGDRIMTRRGTRSGGDCQQMVATIDQAGGGAGPIYRIFSMDCAALSAYRRAGDISRLQLLRYALSREAVAEFAKDDPLPGLEPLSCGLRNLLPALVSPRKRPLSMQYSTIDPTLADAPIRHD
jgi:hypothetical protein